MDTIYEIMIVDDSISSLQLLSEILTRNGYIVRPAQSGEIALRSVMARVPDMILLDVKMPGMDGLEVCRRLKADERLKNIPVLFISGINDVSKKAEGFRTGGIDYISKPFDEADVLARIELHISLNELRSHLEQRVEERTRDLIQANERLMLEIAERQKMEEKLFAVNEKLTEVNVEKDKLFSFVAHDLRSPFSGLLGLSKILNDRCLVMPKDEIADVSELIYSSATNIFKLVENLLDWSRLQRGMFSFQPKRVELCSIVRNSLSALHDVIVKKGVSVEVHGNEEFIVYADEAMIESVLRNLIVNAVKFSHRGGYIIVGCTQREDGMVEISVSDTGIGMCPAILNNLFKLGCETGRTGTDNEPSSGLGLLLCKEFVVKNGGTISVSSTEGNGSTFYFTVPEYTTEFEKMKILIDNQQSMEIVKHNI